MKRNLTFPMIIISALLLMLSNISLAADSTSIRVACTIPAIPGVNVPLIEEDINQENIDNQITEEHLSHAQEISDPNSPAMFQKDEQEIRLAQGQKSHYTVKTIYSR